MSINIPAAMHAREHLYTMHVHVAAQRRHGHASYRNANYKHMATNLNIPFSFLLCLLNHLLLCFPLLHCGWSLPALHHILVSLFFLSILFSLLPSISYSSALNPTLHFLSLFPHSLQTPLSTFFHSHSHLDTSLLTLLKFPQSFKKFPRTPPPPPLFKQRMFPDCSTTVL